MAALIGGNQGATLVQGVACPLGGYATGGGSYSTEAAAFFARITDPGTTRKDLLAALIDGLVSDGVWTLLDALWILAADIEATAQTNLKSSSFGLTKSGTPTWSADHGYTGNGSGYFDTGLNINTVQADKNSCSLGSYVLNSRTAAQNYCEIGCTDTVQGAELFPNISSNIVYLVVNDSIYANTPSSQAQGLWALTRTGLDDVLLYRNGSLYQAISPVGASNKVNQNVYVLARNDNGTPTLHSQDQLAAAFVGRALNATQAGNLSTRINNYMTGLPTPINVY